MNKYNILLKCLIAASIMVIPSLGGAEEMHYSLGTGLEFTSGTYGTGSRTNTVYIPFTAVVYPTERFDFSVEIPIVYQSNNNVITTLGSAMHGGQSTANSSAASSTTGTGMMGGSSGMSGGMGQGGLGDITIKTGYILATEKELMPQIRPNVFLKFPTADKNKALGTGEYDAGAALELWKWLDNWCTYTEVGYVLQGKSSDIPLKNYLYYTVGTGYQITDAFRTMLLLKGSTETFVGADPLLEARLKLKYQASKHTGVTGYFAKGISTSSPDYGTGVAVFYDF